MEKICPKCLEKYDNSDFYCCECNCKLTEDTNSAQAATISNTYLNVNAEETPRDGILKRRGKKLYQTLFKGYLN